MNIVLFIYLFLFLFLFFFGVVLPQQIIVTVLS